MLKIAEFILILFSGISLIVIAFLFNGIEIEKISYKNINIEKLYLKYDKKLTISLPKITIIDKNASTIAKMRTDFTLDYENFNIVLDVKNFLLVDTDLQVQGVVLIDMSTIDFEKKSSVVIENLVLEFDKKVKKVYAKKAFVSFENNQFNATFEKPLYHDVDMTNSRLTYNIDENILKLYLQTKSLFNDSLDQILTRYDVNIPLKQYSGKNNFAANIFIPFSKGDFFIETKIQSKDAVVESYGQKIALTDFSLDYDNKSNRLNGNGYLLQYVYNDINFSNATIQYDVLFQKNTIVQLSADEIQAKYDDNKFYLNNTTVNFENLKMKSFTQISSDSNNTFLDFNNSTDFETKKSVSNLSVDYQKEDHLYNFKILNEMDFDTHSAEGMIVLNKVIYENLLQITNKNIPYTLLFDTDVLFNISEFGLSYFKEENTNIHNLDIKKPNKIMDAFTFLTYKKQSDGIIEIQSEDLNNTTVNIDNLNFDINSSYFVSDTNQTKSLTVPSFPKIALNYKNSTLKYDDYTLDFDTLYLDTDENKLDLNITKDATKIELKIKDTLLEAHGLNMTDKYVNKFLDKQILEGGEMNINIYADDINFLMGDVNFSNTTVKNVTLLNSITTFVNTTPAIINPLLALPTLFRMAETGFDTNGYYMKSGDGSFHYSVPNKQLDIFDFITNGKMSNFMINSHIDYTTDKIEANADISFLKDFTKAINHIPLIGYIFLGNDGEVHTSVDITGTLDNPILETHTVKEGAKGVSDVIKRILTLPLQPFDIETSPEQLKEHNKRVDEMINNSNL